MRAVRLEGFGGPEMLRPADLAEPPVGPDGVRIRVEAAGVNPVDTKLRQGTLEGAFPHLWPVVLGWDVSGTVEAVGPAVTSFRPGDAVLAYCRKDFVGAGAYAELVTVAERDVAGRGDLDPIEAGGLPLAGLTAYQGLRDALGLQAGETVVVRGASGGVGSFAVQIARAVGARVIGVASASSEEYVLGLGADEFVDYAQPGAAGRVRGAHALLDLAGGEDLAEWIYAVSRVASVLVPDVRGRYVFVRPGRAQLQELVAMRLRIPVSDTFPLDRAADAHRRLEQGGVRGKLILIP